MNQPRLTSDSVTGNFWIVNDKERAEESYLWGEANNALGALDVLGECSEELSADSAPSVGRILYTR